MKSLDKDEAKRIVNTYSDLILRLSYTYLKSTQDAEDICQTVLLKFMTNEKTLKVLSMNARGSSGSLPMPVRIC